LDDSKSTFYNNKALALYHIGKLRDSLYEYDKAIDLDKSDAKIHYNRGNTNLAMGKNKEAHDDFDKAI